MRPAYPFRIIQRSAAGGDWTTDATSLLTRPEGRRPWIRERLPTSRPGHGLQPYGGRLRDRNPSARRSGVVIEGWCEECDFRWMFSLSQHKGETFVDIVRYEADKGPPNPRHV